MKEKPCNLLGLGSSLARVIEISNESGLDSVISNLHTSPTCKLFSKFNQHSKKNIYLHNQTSHSPSKFDLHEPLTLQSLQTRSSILLKIYLVSSVSIHGSLEILIKAKISRHFQKQTYTKMAMGISLCQFKFKTWILINDFNY